jgi:N-acetyl-1-D-myo-inositol-2-amino-2-deoxy-alpha-D-glucopyranoside deacetylase
VKSKKRVVGKNLSAVMKAATVAVFGTILHQSFLFDQFPIGSVLSLSLVLIVALQIRTNSGFRSPNLFFSVVILGLLFLFSQGFWQDKMIPANQAGFIWSYGAAVLAFAVAMWPRISSKQWRGDSRPS